MSKITSERNGEIRKVAQYFLRGLIIVAPAVVTLYITWLLISWVDNLIPFGIPGLGILVTLLLITAVGALASTLVTRTLLDGMDRVLERVPFVRLLYTSSKDLLNAFVGEHRRFTKGVMVPLAPGSPTAVLGFVTADSLEHLGIPGYVAVYLPQSYNFAGNLILVPADQVTPVSGDSAELMSFIVSGGVSGGPPDRSLQDKVENPRGVRPL